MNFDINWSKENYHMFLAYLNSLADEKYKKFHSKLILKNDLIGVRTPKLKIIAKEISKYNYSSFFKINKHKFYEEKTIHGLVIGYLKNYDEAILYLNNFFEYIDNWATCDLMCANLKILKNNLDKSFTYIKELINSKEVWKTRTGLVLLNNYYIDDKYIDEIFKIIDNVNLNQYYVNIAIAWLLSTCYINYKDKTYNYLLNDKLDNWIHNKAIQKINDSKRVGDKDKKKINSLKR